MSCDGNRAKYFAAAAGEAAVCQALGGDDAHARVVLTTLYDTASKRQDVAPALADALTRVLFTQMRVQGLTPPAHAADGMPKRDARQGYAAVAQTLLAARGGRALPALAAQLAQASAAPAALSSELLAAYGGRRSGPDTVSIIVDGRSYAVSGSDFTTMKDAIKAYVTRHGMSASHAFDPVAKTWRMPGTLADVQAALPAYVVTDPAATSPSAPRTPVPPASVPTTSPPARETHRIAPNAAAGTVPLELHSILQHYLDRMIPAARDNVVAFANGDALFPGQLVAVHSVLALIARDINVAVGKKRSALPIVYWARQYARSDAKRHALSVAVLTALGHVRCPDCGQFLPTAPSASAHVCPSAAFDTDGFNGLGVNRYGETRYGTKASGMPAPRRKTIGEAAKDLISESDPMHNTGMADLWGRVASAVAGHDCRVVLREGGGFATNMQGTIYADPYPLGHDADPRHNLIITKAGIYHEIGHELTTPPEDWAYVLEVAAGTQTIPGIDKGTTFVTKMYNIVEDGRMERDMSGRFLGVAETLEAQCAIYPRWGERVGAGVSLSDEVVWPLLYTALPYFRVRDEVRAAMTPAGRALFEELEPIALGGALGTTEDSLAAAIEITRRLEAAGVLDVPETGATPPPAPAPGTKPRSAPPERREAGEPQDGQGGEPGEPQEGESGASGEPQEGESGESGEPQDGEGESANDGAGADSAAPERTPAVPETAVSAPLTEDRLDDILNDLEAQAVSAVEREATRQGTYDALGTPLHAPVTGSTASLWANDFGAEPKDVTPQRYRAPDGTVKTTATGTPIESNPAVLKRLAARRPEQQAISGRLARRLDSIRQETITRLRMLPEGRLDRRRFPAALAGRLDVRTRTTSDSATGMAVSLLLDQSGSMNDHITTGKLYDATCIMAQALEQLNLPYEVRGHGGCSSQYKAIGDATLDPKRAARLARDDSGSNAVTAPVVGLATAALLARPDQNRLIVNLMDGEMDDHRDAVTQYRETRKQGIVTFGVFLGTPYAGQQAKMTELFGANNWRPIASLTDLPGVVGQRIADIFESLGEE